MLLRRVAAACALVCVSPVLAACGGADAAAIKVKDVIPANEDDQFESGKSSTIAIPVGRLEIWTGKPTDSVERTETRQLEALDAPDGAVLVPITWRFDGGFEDVADYLGEAPAPAIELVSEGERYRLPTPDLDEKAGESFYVVVDGDAEDLTMEVEFDGETQSVDLLTRERDEGRARSLYRIDVGRLRPQDCGSSDWKTGELIAVDYTCDTTGPVLLPYAAGEWAEPGRLWLGLRVKTTLRRWAVAERAGGGAFYAGTGTKLRVELGGEQPVTTLKDAVSECPLPATTDCVVDVLMVFDVPEEDVPTKLSIDQRFRLVLTTRWGGFSPDERMISELGGTVRLDLPDTDKRKRKGNRRADRD